MTLRSKSAQYVVEAHLRGYRVQPDGTAFGPKGELQGSRHKGRRGPGIYRTINLKVGTTTRRVFVHQLQAYQKFGEAALAEGTVVRHLNGNSLDNREENIAIGNRSQDAFDRPESVRKAAAQKAANARKIWNDEDVARLRKCYQEGASQKDLAAAEGVGKSVMSMMLRGITYPKKGEQHG